MLVVDASVAVKWVLPESDSHLALALRSDGRLFGAPSLIVEEVGNVAWQRARRREISRARAIDLTRVAIGLFSMIVPAKELYEHALTFAIDLDHPIYDCFYLALASRERAPIVTADARLAQLARRAGVNVEPLA